MKSTLRCFFTSAWLVALLSIAILGSSTAAFADQEESSTGPEGSWFYTVNISGFTFQGIETYAAGGGYSEADQLSFSPGAVASAGHGTWKSMGHGRFLLTYLNLTFDYFTVGTPTGTLKVRQTATIDKTGNSYSGSGDYAYNDTFGKPVLNGSGTFQIKAQRILVEAPGR